MRRKVLERFLRRKKRNLKLKFKVSVVQASMMAQQVKATAVQAGHLEFDSHTHIKVEGES